jgi:hypothetical protein
VRPSESKEGKEAAMKRIRLLVLLGVVAVALPLGGVFAANAGAAGSTTATNSVSISQYADFNIFGTQLDVNLLVRCTGGSGVATVVVNQDSPETGVPDTTGTGANIAVVCDGKTHSVGVTVEGVVYDPGKAYAIADILVGTSVKAHAEKWITIKVV